MGHSRQSSGRPSYLRRYVYGANNRLALNNSGGTPESLYSSWGGSGFIASSSGYYVTDYAAGKLWYARSAYYTSWNGWEYKAIVTGLTTPGQICGIRSGKLFYVSNSNTQISALDLTALTSTAAVTGLTLAVGCAMDAAGSGDLIVSSELCCCRRCHSTREPLHAAEPRGVPLPATPCPPSHCHPLQPFHPPMPRR